MERNNVKIYNYILHYCNGFIKDDDGYYFQKIIKICYVDFFCSLN